MKIGFDPVPTTEDLSATIEHSMNIAITIDDTYGMPAAVCL